MTWVLVFYWALFFGFSGVFILKLRCFSADFLVFSFSNFAAFIVPGWLSTVGWAAFHLGDNEGGG